jgi:hypothetical protein
MGQGAVRSQMDIRISFRVRERKDVDLILGQGMLAAGWHAHTLNAPGKFLIAAAEHDTPKRARAYLLTDQVVEAAANYCRLPPDTDTMTTEHSTRRLRHPAVDRAGTCPDGGDHGPRPDDLDRQEPPVDLPTPTRADRPRPRDPSKPWPLAGRSQ